jgi:Family of unknown function (DUF5762)
MTDNDTMKVPSPDPKPTEIKGKQSSKEVHVPFWSENPNILLQHPTEFYPTDNMSYNEKLNAITRSTLVLTFISLFFSTQRFRLLLIGILTMFVIYLVHKYYHDRSLTEEVKEGLELNHPSPALDYLESTGVEISPMVFQEPSPSNPFSNVMMSDYDYNPNKLPAPPASNPIVQDLITTNAKRLVQEANPGQPDIDQKLFRDVNDQIDFEHSMRPFHSNPITTIPNDQGAFAEFCYGSMISCKEGNLFACARNTSHYTLT